MAFLSYTTHALAENRHGLIVDVHTTPATGTAEREAALVMVKRSVKPASGCRKPTVAADRGYDTAEFVGALMALGIAPPMPIPQIKRAIINVLSESAKTISTVSVA